MMLKQASTPYTGQLLALHMPGGSAECIVLPWNDVTLITPTRRSVYVDDAEST